MKFRLISKTFLLSAAVAAGAGCSDFLDTSLDQNETGESIETTLGTLWKFGNAFYTPIASGYTTLDSNLFAAATDEAQQTKVQCNASYFNKGVINANLNPISNLYTDCYEGIRAANFFLDYTANGKGEYMVGMNRDTINDRPNYERDLASLHWYQAEAHIARAYYYAELIKQYGGVPIVESQYAANKFIPRSSYDQVVEYIVKEIDDHKGKLAVDWASFSERNGRFTLGAALAIKARVLLYAASPLHNPDNDVEKWKKAAAAAYDIISNPDLNYSLDSDYGAYFQGNRSLSSPETIYVVRREHVFHRLYKLAYSHVLAGADCSYRQSERGGGFAFAVSCIYVYISFFHKFFSVIYKCMKKPCAAQENETFCEGCGERVAVCGEVLSVKDAKMSTSLRLSWLASVL